MELNSKEDDNGKNDYILNNYDKEIHDDNNNKQKKEIRHKKKEDDESDKKK
jgi:hypothetical protein